MKFKNFFVFIVSFLVFYIIFFLINLFFFTSKDTDNYNEILEEKTQTYNTAEEDDFIDINLKEEETQDIKKRYEEIINEYKNNLIEEKLSEKEDINVTYEYNPLTLEKYLISQNKLENISNLLNSKLFSGKTLNFTISFISKITDGIRGKYKNLFIYLYSPQDLSVEELEGVFIHELGHYIDINYFENGVFGDTSSKFYDISWESSKVMKAGLSQKDFVSGYSMTNKYEDFAESFIYYVIDNKNFLEKSENSKYLKKKI